MMSSFEEGGRSFQKVILGDQRGGTSKKGPKMGDVIYECSLIPSPVRVGTLLVEVPEYRDEGNTVMSFFNL